MKLQIYALKDKDLGCFLQPYYTDTTADNSAEHMRRFCCLEEPEKVLKYKHRVVYHLGVFDDVSGVIEHNDVPTLVFDCDEVIDKRFADNGKVDA